MDHIGIWVVYPWEVHIEEKSTMGKALKQEIMEELNVIDEHSQEENKNQGRSCNNMRRRLETCIVNSTPYKILFQIIQGDS